MKKKTFWQQLWTAMMADEKAPYINPLMLALGQFVNIVIVILFAMLVCFLMGSCKTTHEVQTVYVHTTDTLTQTVNKRDSIYVHDSVFYSTRRIADTVFIEREKWHTAYIDRLQHDSIYINRTDTCYRDVVKTIEYKPTWWQSFTSGFGYTCMLMLLFALLYYATRRIKL